MNTIKFIIVLSIALLSIDLVYQQVVNGQEVNMTDASRQAKEILCKEYNIEYCEGQEVNNNTSDCFTIRDFFSPYYSWSRCRLD